MKYLFYLKKFWVLYAITAVLCLCAALGTSEAVTTVAQNSPVTRSHILVIDAGHGGEDGGATSCTGILESQINLQIALRLNDLCHLLGYETKMIRTTDISVYTEGNTIAQKKISDLKQRVKIVNETDNAVLISIHQNTFPIEKYSGAQVFYNRAEGAKSFAERLQAAFVQTINPGSNRKCKSADGIYLMQHVTKPAVLIECGFLSNPQEEADLHTAWYQQQICCVIASALSCYLNA